MMRLMKILLIIPLIYMLAAPVWLSSYYGSRPCRDISIVICDSSDYDFVTRKQLLSLVNGREGSLLGRPQGSLPLWDIEGRVRTLKELREAEAYMSIDGILNVDVYQRNPVMRVIPDEGGDFLVDAEGVLIRKRTLQSPRLHIVGGDIAISRAMLEGTSILDAGHNVLKDAYHFVRYISGDDFWSAQIDQIYVDKRGKIDLIPRAGNHRIHLGTFENFEGKLKNLAAFYENVIPETGWDKYSVISLEFRDQIVCKKRQQAK